MDGRYVILKTRRFASSDPFSRPVGPAARGAEVVDFDVAIEVDQLRKNELALRSRDADVLAIAPAMRMKLIAPKQNFAERVDAESSAMTWAVSAVGADTSTFTGKGIVAAVLDTGIDAGHPAFADMDLIEEDFTGEGNGDQQGHGTHCAGIMFGRDVNGKRIGIATGVKKALIGKVLDRNGSGSTDQICNAIMWAANNGANVISMSLGLDFPGFQRDLQASGFPPEVATSVALEGYRKNVLLFERLATLLRAQSAMAQATIIVAAAGNESNRPEWEVAVAPPAVADGIISVAALGRSAQGFHAASFSNTGANIAAPGVDIPSAKLGGGLVSLSGTSMATPCVAGVAALWAEKLKAVERLNTFNLSGNLIASALRTGFAQNVDALDVGAGIVRCPQQ